MYATALELLKADFAKRRHRNPRFSLQAYSRRVKIPPGRLSELFAGKRRMTVGLADKVAEALELSPSAHRRLRDNVLGERKALKRRSSLADERFRVLSDDTFLLIANWWHYAILSLMRTKDFRGDPSWIAERLGISSFDVRDSLERLERLGMIRKKGASWRRTTPPLTSSQDVPSVALRKCHRESLERAMAALTSVGIENRDFSTVTFSGNPARLAKAKILIKDFRRRLSRYMEGGSRSEVYELNVQLVPLTRVRK